MKAFTEGQGFLPSAEHLLSNCLLSHVMRRYAATSKHLQGLLVGRCMLVQQLQALREAFLLEHAAMSKEMSEVLFSRLDHWDDDDQGLSDTVVAALRTSPLCDQHLADHISVEVNKADLVKASTIGKLECLVLKHNVAWPLNMIISEESTAKYNKIFVFLLQLLRAKNALESMTQLTSKGRQHRSPVAHLFFCVKAEIYHFVHTIHCYVMSRVVDSVWTELKASIENGTEADLDHLQGLHDRYLDRIMYQTLLFSKGEGVLGAIRKILSLCLDLQRLHTSHLFDHIEQNHVEDEVLQRSLNAVAKQRLETVRKEFQQHFRFLLFFLTNFVETGFHPHLDDVLTRLNFNAHYTVQ